MKVSTLIHNPGAGAEKYTKESLVSKIEVLGYDCRYSSTKKKGWKEIDSDTDFIIIAGGDGTVRKVIKKLLDRKILRKRFPLALLPLGTANNISKSLGISGEPEELAKSWKKELIKCIDIGFIEGLGEPNFFIEALGYGIFPKLMETMKAKDDKLFLSLDTEINYSLQILHEMILSYTAQDLQLEIDGVDHSGKFILAEIMNIKSVGPNLVLAPEADPSDGQFEIILVTEDQKEDFANYILNKIKGVEDRFVPQTIKGSTIRLQADNTHIHIDDELIWVDDPAVIKIDVYEGLLKVFVPDAIATE
jgi:diacylglycerol kinase family enzyme